MIYKCCMWEDWNQKKGVHLLLEAAHLLSERDILFRIVGYGSFTPFLERKVTRQSNVELVGAQPHGEMLSVFQGAEVFLLPSFTEGIPVAILEAMATKPPVITTPVGIIPELFQDQVHALIPLKGDPHSLAEAIIKLKANPQLRQKLTENAYHLLHQKLTSYLPFHLKTYHRTTSKIHQKPNTKPQKKENPDHALSPTVFSHRRQDDFYTASC